MSFYTSMHMPHHATAGQESGGYRLEESHKACPRRRQRPGPVPHQTYLALGTEVRERHVDDFGVTTVAGHWHHGHAESRSDEAFHRRDLGRLEDNVGVDAVLSPQLIGELPQTG